jgi:hypothetical protein
MLSLLVKFIAGCGTAHTDPPSAASYSKKIAQSFGEARSFNRLKINQLETCAPRAHSEKSPATLILGSISAEMAAASSL